MKVLEKKSQLEGKNTDDAIYFTIEEHPELKTKWAHSGKGQNQFGGFGTAGVKTCNDLREKCTEARKKPENMAIERGALANVKDKHGIAQDLTRALWERPRKKKGSVASAAEEVAGLWEEPDDEFR